MDARICRRCDRVLVALGTMQACDSCGGPLIPYNVSEFLERLGLQQYVPAFEQQAISLELVASLSDDDLRQIGVVPLGHRRLIQSRARADFFGEEERPELSTSVSGSDIAWRMLALVALVAVGVSPLLPWARGISGIDAAEYVGHDAAALYLVYFQIGVAVLTSPFAAVGRLPRLASVIAGLFPLVVFAALLLSGRSIERVIRVLDFGIYVGVAAGIVHLLTYRPAVASPRRMKRSDWPGTPASQHSEPVKGPEASRRSDPSARNVWLPLSFASLMLVALAPVFPWAVGGLTGLDLASKASQLSAALYLIYLQPLGAILVAPFLALRTLPRFVAVLVGLLPIVSLSVVLFAADRVNSLSRVPLLSLLREGVWLGLVGGIALMASYPSRRTREYSKPMQAGKDYSWARRSLEAARNSEIGMAPVSASEAPLEPAQDSPLPAQNRGLSPLPGPKSSQPHRGVLVTGQPPNADPERASLPNWTLVVVHGRSPGERYSLDNDVMIVGRRDPESGYAPDIDLFTQEPLYVHRQHARLFFNELHSELSIRDLGGKNGTNVNGRRLGPGECAVLRARDKITLGPVELRLENSQIAVES